MADVTGHARCLGSIPSAPLTECSSVGRTPTAVLVAEGQRWFESIYSDYHYLHLVRSSAYVGSMGDVLIVVAHYRLTKNSFVSRVCRFESGWHGLGRKGSTPLATILNFDN